MTTQPQSPSEQEIDEQAEQLAMLFHATYEKLAPNFGYKTREASAVPWLDVPKNNRELMLAVMRLEILPWHNEATAQAADKREQEVLDQISRFLRKPDNYNRLSGAVQLEWVINAAGETGSYVAAQLAQLRQGRAAEGEGKNA